MRRRLFGIGRSRRALRVRENSGSMMRESSFLKALEIGDLDLDSWEEAIARGGNHWYRLVFPLREKLDRLFAKELKKRINIQNPSRGMSKASNALLRSEPLERFVLYVRDEYPSLYKRKEFALIVLEACDQHTETLRDALREMEVQARMWEADTLRMKQKYWKNVKWKGTVVGNWKRRVA